MLFLAGSCRQSHVLITAMTYKAVLFDLDGTLLDTLEDLGSAMNCVLAKRGFPTHKLDAYRFFIGDGAVMLVKRSLPKGQRSDETVQLCLKAFQNRYAQTWNVKTKPYEGITDMLDALTKRGLKLAVLSNKPHVFTQRCVTELLADWKFEVILGHQDPLPRKPDPAGALRIAQLLKVPPRQFLYLGDSGVDLQTARAAGMCPVGVLWGFRPVEELQQNGAGALLKHPLDILDLVN